MNDSLKIFMDTDAFVALVKEDDSNHNRAKRIFQKLQAEPVVFSTSNYVFSETVTVLSQRVSHVAAVEFIKKMKSDENPFDIQRVEEEVENRAIEIFIAQTSKNISYVDCVNIAVIKKNGYDAIFSFDKAYRKNGIKVTRE